MTIPSPSDDLVSPPLLDDRETGRTAMERFWETQNPVAPRTSAARLFGRTPLTVQSRPWYLGAVGEMEVAERLRALGTRGEAWRVLHSVPVADGVSDVDHVVIGPAGVFTLVVGPGTARAAGRGRAEAGRAAILLEAALGAPVPVTPLIVVTTRRAPSPDSAPDVETVPAARIDRNLSARRPIYSVDEVRELTRAALKPRTWHPRAPRTPEERAGSRTVPSAHELQTWFGRVRSEVDAARRVQVTWLAAAGAVVVAAVIASPELVQGLIG